MDEALLAEVREVRDRALETASHELPPPPLVDSPKCPRCSLVGICLPDEQHLLEGDGEDVRRLYPARDDATPVYVQAQGAKVGKRGEELEIWERDLGRRRVRLLDVSQLCLFGNVSLSAPALHELCRRGVPISHFSYGGWFYGVTRGLGPRNAMLRMHQYEAARDAVRTLDIARGFVERKIRNCRTLLRRNARDLPDGPLRELERLASEATRAENLQALLGIEGMAARTYFGEFSRMLRPPGQSTGDFDFEGRNRRPPRDPVNALLSLAYSILTSEWTHTLFAVGLDPFFGFLHQPRFGRPALSLDLMEEFRPLIADSVVLQLVNNGEIQAGDLLRRGGAVALKPEGRKKFFLAWDRRMNHLVTHPLFGYRVSYRRLLEVQSRLFGRFLSGELPSYDGFRTR